MYMDPPQKMKRLKNMLFPFWVETTFVYQQVKGLNIDFTYAEWHGQRKMICDVTCM